MKTDAQGDNDDEDDDDEGANIATDPNKNK